MQTVESCINVWNKCLGIIQDNVNDSVFSTWFTPVVPLKYDGNDFIIQVPSQFFYEYIEEKYANLIYQTLLQVTGKEIDLNYRILVDNSGINNGEHALLLNEYPGHNDKIQWTTKDINKASNDLYPSSIQNWNPNLNQSLCFDNFFEGTSNKLARSIAVKISEEPGKDFNPCFIYGRPGVGKTHLCHAIGNKIRELLPQKRVLYISAHLFEVQFTDARRNNTHNEFVHYYQNVDVLVLDDIHELAGKEKTQQAYFHIFNHLKLLGKQLVLTADKAPVDINGLEERLLSRLKWGLMLELQKPDLELRKKILYYKMKQEELALSDEIINYIAERVTEHVRDLEGIISSLVAHSLVYGKKTDMELVKQMVINTVKAKKQEITVEKISSVVSSYFHINIDQIHSKSRKREIVQARQIIMFLAKKYTDQSYSLIGNRIGKRNHATVLHACKTIQDNMDINKAFQMTMQNIEKQLIE